MSDNNRRRRSGWDSDDEPTVVIRREGGSGQKQSGQQSSTPSRQSNARRSSSSQQYSQSGSYQQNARRSSASQQYAQNSSYQQNARRSSQQQYVGNSSSQQNARRSSNPQQYRPSYDDYDDYIDFRDDYEYDEYEDFDDFNYEQPQPRSGRARPAQRPVQTPPPKKRRREEKKHHGFRNLLLILLLLIAGVVAFALTGSPGQIEGNKDGYYSVLVFGTDVASGSTDTIMLASVNTNDGTCRVVSIPRDTLVLEDGSPRKVNSVYAAYGLDGLKQEVKNLTGIYPDYYVKVDWASVGAVVGAIGGVDFDVPCDMNYDDPAQNLSIHLSQGEQTLNADQAMQLVRWRKNSDGSLAEGFSGMDTDRINVQHSFLKAVVSQALTPAKLPRLMIHLPFILSQYTESDLSLHNIVWFATKFFGMDTDTDLTFDTLPADYFGSYNGTSYVIAMRDDTLALMNQSYNPYTRDLTETDLCVTKVNSNGVLYQLTE